MAKLRKEEKRITAAAERQLQIHFEKLMEERKKKLKPKFKQLDEKIPGQMLAPQG